MKRHIFTQLSSFLMVLLHMLVVASCRCQPPKVILTGAEQTEKYLPLLSNKNVGLVVNHTSKIGDTHLIDTLLARNIRVTAIFSPEHGLRGTADAGAKIMDGKDTKTGLPVYSLHGSTKKPLPQQLKNIELIVFDMQDVGVRFYTYISTMHYVMESCAENKIPLIILDRPNPLGFYVDGPVLDTAFRSFVGMHPIPIVHGLSIGELAQMINGEGWLKNKIQCELTIIETQGWTHATSYTLPIQPSPNLPNQQAILLYPSLCLFEATDLSIGRGTQHPFQTYAYPDPSFRENITFTPRSIAGMATHPKHENVECFGTDLRHIKPVPRFTLQYILSAKQRLPKGTKLISNGRWFNLLAGNDRLQQQIDANLSEKQIRASWQKELELYRKLREKYLLYPNN